MAAGRKLPHACAACMPDTQAQCGYQGLQPVQSKLIIIHNTRTKETGRVAVGVYRGHTAANMHVTVAIIIMMILVIMRRIPKVLVLKMVHPCMRCGSVHNGKLPWRGRRGVGALCKV